MMSTLKLSIGGLALLVSLAAGCGKETTPNRDHIPELRQQLYKLQLAVVDKNRAAVDSLLSVDILDIDQNSDSLFNFVYGAGARFEFRQFGNAAITYTSNKARIDCFIMDSTALEKRPITFTLILDDDNWLFKRFEPGLPRLSDSASTDSVM